MTWVRIDDRTTGHPKHLDAGPEAFALWVAGLCYANAHHTDGLIERRRLPVLYPGQWADERLEELAGKLESVGLWDADGDNWQIHDYEQYQAQATRAYIEEKRAKDRERQARKRERDRASRAESQGESRRDTQRDTPHPSRRESQRDGPRDTPRDSRRDDGRDSARDEPRDDVGDGGSDDLDVSRPPVPSRPDPSRIKKHRDVNEAASSNEPGGASPPAAPSSVSGDASSTSKGQRTGARPSTDEKAAAERLFAHWCEKTDRNPNRCKLTTKRQRLVAARLREGYDEETLVAAIDGIAASDFHRGSNEQATRYDDMEHAFRDGGAVEKWAAKARPSHLRLASTGPLTDESTDPLAHLERGYRGRRAGS